MQTRSRCSCFLLRQVGKGFQQHAECTIYELCSGAWWRLVVEPEEEFDASNSFLAQGLAADAPCALQWDKDRCIRYGPRLGEHMVSRYALAQSVVKCLPVEGKPI